MTNIISTNTNVIAIIFTIIVLQCTTCFAKDDDSSTTSSTSFSSSIGILPGTEPFSNALQQKLIKKKNLRGNTYQPRTKHFLKDGSAKYTNRLFLESSPYLLQHAHNPVNWYPWGNEAFETAEELNRPVLLSIGYSTCHWCHVMEEESFEDEEIAKFINENYVAIKVDREERPDVDSIYMVAVQTLTGRGGWPMTAWLTHERKPFYGGTYFPARDGDRGMPTGFLTLLKTLKNIYDKQPEKVAEQSQQLAKIISSTLRPQTNNNQLPSVNVIHNTFSFYKSGFDPINGGLSHAPKFPSDLSTRFLLRYAKLTNNPKALEMATLTLKKMAAGGIYDHVGGGFHRYSTDKEWLIPHFEKMLYDNALLAIAYLEAYQLTGDENFVSVTKEILRYVERDMTSSKGAFYSATDADSIVKSNRREEGYFFTWTTEELDQVLGKKISTIVKRYFAVSDKGNFKDRNILHVPKDKMVVANELNLSAEKLASIIAVAKVNLYIKRNKRSLPIRDEKILTAWNGLMISAYARAGLILGEKDYINQAEVAAEFIKTHLFANGRLFRSYNDDTQKLNAYLDDYAFYIAATLDLYEATHDIEWLNFAIELDNTLSKHYEDDINGGFFLTSDDHENLLVREKPYFDGAKPSGNSVAVLNLLRLYEFTSNDAYRKRANKAFMSAKQFLEEKPTALSELIIAMDFYFDKPKEIIIVTPKNKKFDAERFIKKYRLRYLPNSVLIVLSEGREQSNVEKSIPLVRGKLAIQGKTTAYVCEQGICNLPTADPDVFLQQISNLEKIH